MSEGAPMAGLLTRRIRVLCILGCLLFPVAACGGDDDASPAESAAPDSGDTTAGGTDTTTGGTDTVVASPPASAVTAPTMASGDVDPCALLTAQELVDVTGVEFGEGTFNEALSVGGNVICDWVAADTSDTVQVLIHPDPAVFELSRESAAGFDMEIVDVDVAGADAAYIIEGGIVGTSIGGMFLQVSYLASGDTADRAVELAELAASRML